MKVDPYQKKSLMLFGILSLIITLVDAVFIIFFPQVLQQLLPINLFFVVFALFLACTRFAGIKLKSRSLPFKQLQGIQWVAAIFLIECIAGLLFLNVLQASQLFLNADVLILNFQIPKPTFVLNLVLMQWGLFPFSLIAILAAGLSYVHYYKQQSATISHLLPSFRKTYYEVFVQRVVTGSLGVVSNFVLIISISIGVLTTGRLILSLTHITDSTQLRMGSLVFFVVITVLSALKVVPWVALQFSRFFRNEALAILCYMLLALLLFLCCNVFAFNIIDFTARYISLPNFHYLNIHSALQVHWPLITWAWWICWTPLIATAIARVSYGYSMRAIIVATLFFPAVVLLLLELQLMIPDLAVASYFVFHHYALAMVGPFLLIAVLMRVNGGKLLVFGFMPKDSESITTKTIRPIHFIRSTLQLIIVFMAVFLIRNIYGIQFLMLLAAIPNTILFVVMSLLFYKKIMIENRG